MKRETIAQIISALFIILFLYTGLNKLLVTGDMFTVLSSFPVIGKMAASLTWLLPAIEIAVAILLFIPRTRYAGLITATGLMVVFTGYVGNMLLFTPDRPCTCGGMLKMLSWPQHLAFNIIFLGLASCGLYAMRKNRVNQKSIQQTTLIENDTVAQQSRP